MSFAVISQSVFSGIGGSSAIKIFLLHVAHLISIEMAIFSIFYFFFSKNWHYIAISLVLVVVSSVSFLIFGVPMLTGGAGKFIQSLNENQGALALSSLALGSGISVLLYPDNNLRWTGIVLLMTSVAILYMFVLYDWDRHPRVLAGVAPFNDIEVPSRFVEVRETQPLPGVDLGRGPVKVLVMDRRVESSIQLTTQVLESEFLGSDSSAKTKNKTNSTVPDQSGGIEKKGRDKPDVKPEGTYLNQVCGLDATRTGPSARAGSASQEFPPIYGQPGQVPNPSVTNPSQPSNGNPSWDQGAENTIQSNPPGFDFRVMDAFGVLEGKKFTGSGICRIIYRQSAASIDTHVVHAAIAIKPDSSNRDSNSGRGMHRYATAHLQFSLRKDIATLFVPEDYCKIIMHLRDKLENEFKPEEGGDEAISNSDTLKWWQSHVGLNIKTASKKGEEYIVGDDEDEIKNMLDKQKQVAALPILPDDLKVYACEVSSGFSYIYDHSAPHQ